MRRIIPLLAVLALAGGFSVAFADGSGSAAPIADGSGSSVAPSSLTGSGSATGTTVTTTTVVTPTPLPDPNENPAEAVSTATKLYHSGTIPAAIIVTAFFALAWLSRHWKWLQDDHRAVIVAAILGGLAVFIEPLTRGATPNASMVGAALIAAVALFANPKKPQADQAKRDVAAAAP